MAISEMTKVVFVAEQANKDRLLESLQEMKSTEIVPFERFTKEDYQDLSVDTTVDSQARNYFERADEALEILDNYLESEGKIKAMLQKPEELTFEKLDERIADIDVVELTDEVLALHNLNSELDNLILKSEKDEDFLKEWAQLNVHPQKFDDFDYFNGMVGSIRTASYKRLIKELDESTDDYTIEEVFRNKDRIGFIIIYPVISYKEVNAALSLVNFEEIDYPYKRLPKEELKRTLSMREQYLIEQREIHRRLSEMDKEREQLTLIKEKYANQLARQSVEKYLFDKGPLFALKGWIAADEVEGTVDNDRVKLSEEDFVYNVLPIDEADNPKDIPVKLKNNWLNSPFESLTTQYSTPMYGQIDPTPFYTLFQILFFGMMSADFGYGLLLFVGTLIPLLFFNLKEGTRKSLKMFNYMSVGTMLVGLFFGSFFGYDLPFRVMNITDQVIEIMLLSVILGIIHMLLGYGLKMYLSIREKDYSSMYLDAIQWILILLGAVLLGANALLGWNNDTVQTIGMYLIVGNIIGMFVVNMIASKNPLVGVGKGLFGIMDLASMVGDAVSYTRLTALGVAGANIAVAFNLIISLFPPIVRFTLGVLLFIALHALNIFITYLGAYVHSMRLEYVELFGKFYDGGGRAFKPLTPVEEEVIFKTK